MKKSLHDGASAFFQSVGQFSLNDHYVCSDVELWKKESHHNGASIVLHLSRKSSLFTYGCAIVIEAASSWSYNHRGVALNEIESSL